MRLVWSFCDTAEFDTYTSPSCITVYAAFDAGPAVFCKPEASIKSNGPIRRSLCHKQSANAICYARGLLIKTEKATKSQNEQSFGQAKHRTKQARRHLVSHAICATQCDLLNPHHSAPRCPSSIRPTLSCAPPSIAAPFRLRWSGSSYRCQCHPRRRLLILYAAFRPCL